MATQPQFEHKSLGNFIQGEFQKPTDVVGEWTAKSPANFLDEIAHITFSYSSIEAAISSASTALRTWRKLSFADRLEYLKKYQAALKNNSEILAETIAREVGKPLWESKTEVLTMVNKIDVTATDSMKFISGFEIPQIMENTNGVCHYKPQGILAVIGPFNFPGHLPNGHIVPALITGNTVIFKPSEKTPMVAQLMAQCFLEAGLPPGVFNMIQGEKEVGRRLCIHDEIDGVLFTGSYEVGTRIKQDTLQQHWKILALEMGGKNSAIVWETADNKVAVLETLLGAFLTAGQRCSATSRIIVHQKILNTFLSEFHSKAKAFSIGYPLDNPFMGALIDQGSVDRYMKFLGIANREGAELIMRGKQLTLGVPGNYVAPSICLYRNSTLESTRKSVFQQTELFAPAVAILTSSDIDEAVALANATQYGLVTSVFCKERATFDKFFEGLDSGLINWNKSTVGASSRLPFGGVKKSGNHFPTAVTATQYCTYPVASLEASEPKLNVSQYPGLNWS